MRPKLQEEDSEIAKMSIFMLNYYQDAESHIDKIEIYTIHHRYCDSFDGEDFTGLECNCGLNKLLK